MPDNKRKLSNIPVEIMNKWKSTTKNIADLIDKSVITITRDSPDFFAILISKDKLTAAPAVDTFIDQDEDFTCSLEWPDGSLFGAIILMDKDQDYNLKSLDKALEIIKNMIESDLELIAKKRSLIERTKELACIYKISQLLLENKMELEDVLLEITKILPDHFAYPELACCRIIYNNLIISESLEKPTGKILIEEVKLSREDYLKVEVYYNSKNPDVAFLSEEKELLESVARHAATIVRRINIEQELIDTRNELYTTLYSIGDGVITTDIDRRIKMMNFTAKMLTGWKYSEAKGKHLNEVFKIENTKTGEKIENPAEKVIEEGEIFSLKNDTTLISKTGRRYQIADSAAPIKDFNNEITGVILVFSEV